MSDYFQFQPPTLYEGPGPKNSWHIFPNTVLSDINVTDCSSSITGVCEYVDTLQECIDMCHNSKELCLSGYYIETPDKQNLCVPIKKHRPGGRMLGPHYRLRYKDFYPIMRKMKTYTFTNTEYEYPPNLPNVVFFTDYFVLKNIASDDQLGIDEEGDITDGKDISNKPTNVQFLPAQIERNYLENYIPVKNGDDIVISIPHTSFVLRKTEGTQQVGWKMRISTTSAVPSNTFRINCSERKIGDWLSYLDKVYFTFQGFPLLYDSDANTFSVSVESVDNAVGDRENILFSMIPKIKGYYCDGGECKDIQLDQAVPDEYHATYNNIPVYRQPACWNVCPRPVKTEKWVKILLWGVIIFVLLFILLLFYLHRKAKSENRGLSGPPVASYYEQR